MRKKRSKTWIAALAGVAVVIAVLYTVSQRSSTSEPASSGVTEFPHIHGMAVDPRDADVLWLGTHGMLVKVIKRTQWIRAGRANYDLMGFNAHPTLAGVFLTSGHPGPGDRRVNPLGVEVSRDAGETWTPLAMEGLADFHAMSVSPADPKVVYAWNVSGRAGFYRSRDSGRTWTFIPTNLRRVFALAASRLAPEEVLAGADTGLFRSTNGGETWTPVHPDLSGIAVTVVAIHPSHRSVWYAYAAHPQFGLLRSEDAGKTWRTLGFSLGERDAVGYLALHPQEPDALYLATFESDIFWSADGGKTRQPLTRNGRVIRP